MSIFAVFRGSSLGLPINAREERRVNAASVDQHEKFAGQHGSKSTNTHGPVIGVDLGYLNPRRQPQDFRDAGRPRAPDIFLSNHENCGRRFPNLFGLF